MKNTGVAYHRLDGLLLAALLVPLGVSAAPVAGPGAATAAIDLSAETVGAQPRAFSAVIGNWAIEADGNRKVLAVDGRKWTQGQASAGVADKARALYGERYAEFLDSVQSYAFFPLAVATSVEDFRIPLPFQSITLFPGDAPRAREQPGPLERDPRKAEVGRVGKEHADRLPAMARAAVVGERHPGHRVPGRQEAPDPHVERARLRPRGALVEGRQLRAVRRLRGHSRSLSAPLLRRPRSGELPGVGRRAGPVTLRRRLVASARRGLEVADGLAEPGPQPRELLRAEEQRDEEQDDEQLGETQPFHADPIPRAGGRRHARHREEGPERGEGAAFPRRTRPGRPGLSSSA